MATKKLSVLLGLRDKVEKTHENMLSDMFQKFKTKQGLFIGVRKTYQAFDGYADEPTKRQFINVASTVSEQLQWFKDNTADYLEIVTSIEKTNATGIKAKLVVDGKDWGEYTTLELLRLKSILDSKLRAMIQELPVRAESVIWKKSEDPAFQDREVFEGPLDKGNAKTTLKESYILTDPHPDQKRQPQVASKDTQVNIGEYTSQDFSGAISMRERALIQLKYDKLYTAVVEALENANNVESQTSDLGKKVLDYLF